MACHRTFSLTCCSHKNMIAMATRISGMPTRSEERSRKARLDLARKPADEQDCLDGATSSVRMAIATWHHLAGDNSSNFLSAASYTLT
jgi:hypothetical protein